MSTENRHSLIAELLDKGESLINSGKYKEAIETFDEVLRINSDISALITLSNFNNEGTRDDSGEYLKVLEVSVIALNWKGGALYKIGKNHEALEVFDQALKIEPENEGILYNKGRTLNELGKYGEAFTILVEVLSINPRSTLALNSIGYTLSKLGKRDNALAAFDAALKIDPNDETASRNRENIIWGIGRDSLFSMLNYESEKIEDINDKKNEPTTPGTDVLAGTANKSEILPGKDVELLEVRHGEKGEVEIMAVPWKGEPYEKEALMAIAILLDALVNEAIPFESTNRNTTILGRNYGEGEPDRIMMSKEYFGTCEEWVKRQKVSTIATIIELYEKHG